MEEEIPHSLSLRERLHANPEPSNAERTTARLVAEALDESDIETVAGAGLIARAGPPRGRAVAVRAELTRSPCRNGPERPSPPKTVSCTPAATTSTWPPSPPSSAPSAARRTPCPGLCSPSTSRARRPTLRGGGDRPREGSPGEIGAVVAAHVHPEVPWGCVSVDPGPVNASCDYLRITVEGVGGHGAYPHRARDPILALSHVVVALQSLVSRRLDPMHPGVFSVGWTAQALSRT